MYSGKNQLLRFMERAGGVRRDAGRSPNAVRDHTRTAQVDFEVDRPPLADSPPGDLLITMVKETVILYKKEFPEIKKK